MVYGVLSGLIFLNIQLQWNMKHDSRLFWIPKYVSRGWMCIPRPVEFSTAKRAARWLNEAARGLTQNKRSGGGVKSDDNSFWTLVSGWNTTLLIWIIMGFFSLSALPSVLDTIVVASFRSSILRCLLTFVWCQRCSTLSHGLKSCSLQLKEAELPCLMSRFTGNLKEKNFLLLLTAHIKMSEQ